MSSEENWVYNLSEDYVTAPESTLVYMTMPEARSELAGFLKDQSMIWKRGDFNDNKIPGDT